MFNTHRGLGTQLGGVLLLCCSHGDSGVGTSDVPAVSLLLQAAPSVLSQVPAISGSCVNVAREPGSLNSVLPTSGGESVWDPRSEPRAAARCPVGTAGFISVSRHFLFQLGSPARLLCKKMG